MKFFIYSVLLITSLNSYAASKVLATVNGANITVAAVENFMLHVKKPISFKAALSEMITIEVLAFERSKTPLEKDSLLQLELDRNRKALIASDTLQRLLKGFDMTEEDIKAAYEKQYLSPSALNEYNASHILVKTKAEAQDIMKQINKNSDFAKLAKKYSTGPSGKNGGSLGWFSLDKMVKPFADATASLTKGNVSQAVQTQFGWHIIKLNDLREKTAPSLESVKAKIERRFSALKLNEEIKALRQSAQITINP